MIPHAIVSQCFIKGISVIGSGDALHPQWVKLWEEELDSWKDDKHGDLVVVPTAEVEDGSRIHHLIIMEEFDQFAELRKRLLTYEGGHHCEQSGRPQIRASAEAIAAEVHACGGLIGPAHAFTPWTGLYGCHDSVDLAYRNEEIDFLELGLSADTSYAAGIAELSHIPFLTNSDAHSTGYTKLGREFTTISLSKLDAQHVCWAIAHGSITRNAGFFPEEGKYSRTACISCYTQYSLEDAVSYHWKCPHDKKRLKKGVFDRARELSSSDANISMRPPYLHIIPLGEIIQRVYGMSSPNTKKCQEMYAHCIADLGCEISILTEIPTEELCAYNPEIGLAISAFREGHIVLHPGGGGKYGCFEFEQ
jgi:uncharacterized protein (TIGR00375 family)